MKKLAFLIIVVLVNLMLMSLIGVPSNGEKNVQARAEGPVKINGNSELHTFAIGGDGTKESPYLLDGLYIDADGSVAISIENTTDYFVIKDSYLFNASYGIYLYNVSNGTIEGNVIMNISSSTNAGIYAKNCSNIEILNNTIATVSGYGILGYVSSKMYVENNTVVNCDGYGIGLSHVAYSKVYHNTAYGNAGGLLLGYSNYVDIFGNILKNNKENGIELYVSNNNLLERNLVKENSIGISLISSSNNITSNNTITRNMVFKNSGYGVYAADNSYGNIIYNNTFYENDGSSGTYNSSKIQAYDKTGRNIWNSTKVGNYWYDWANNNNTNSENGMVKWPYEIAGNSGAFDYLPQKYGLPMAPVNLTAISGSGYINLSWEAPSFTGGENISYYNVYRNGVLYASHIPGTRLWFNDTHVEVGKIYTYYVTAVNSAGESPKSNRVMGMSTGSVSELSPFWCIFFVLIIFIWWRKASLKT